jgi:hypothetical protein
MNQFVPSRSGNAAPALIGEHAKLRFVEFFTATSATATPAAPTRRQ